MNLDLLQGASRTKGCYVGQEVYNSYVTHVIMNITVSCSIKHLAGLFLSYWISTRMRFHCQKELFVRRWYQSHFMNKTMLHWFKSQFLRVQRKWVLCCLFSLVSLFDGVLSRIMYWIGTLWVLSTSSRSVDYRYSQSNTCSVKILCLFTKYSNKQRSMDDK